MIMRYYIKCLTCSTSHTLRISIGHNPKQLHSFKCVNCAEMIKVSLDIDFATLKIDINCDENSYISTQEGTIINLHPELAISSSNINRDSYFPMEDLFKSFDINSMANENPNVKHIDAFWALGGNHLLTEEWAELKRAWSLSLNSKTDLSNKIIRTFFNQKGVKNTPTIREWKHGFSQKLISPYFLQFYNSAKSFIDKIKRNFSDEFEKFSTFYKDNWRLIHVEKCFNIYCEYFSNFSEYSQVILFDKNNIPIPNDSKVTSNAFETVKLFYGNAYEVYTTNIETIACLNNIYKGREFRQFESMNLSKYNKINKAKRTNPFSSTVELKHFEQCLDSSLRNASHHGAMQLDRDTDEIKYQSGGTGAERTIQYCEYLSKCNKIIFSLALLMMLELLYWGE